MLTSKDKDFLGRAQKGIMEKWSNGILGF